MPVPATLWVEGCLLPCALPQGCGGAVVSCDTSSPYVASVAPARLPLAVSLVP